MATKNIKVKAYKKLSPTGKVEDVSAHLRSIDTSVNKKALSKQFRENWVTSDKGDLENYKNKVAQFRDEKAKSKEYSDQWWGAKQNTNAAHSGIWNMRAKSYKKKP